MMNLLQKNFATVSMLLALGMILSALVTMLHWKMIEGDSSTATALVTSIGTIVGGIAGYSMHKTTDSTMQTQPAGGVQVSKTETGA